MSQQLAQLVMQRCDKLGAVSDEPRRLTREFAGFSMYEAYRLVGSWMRKAGMKVRRDAVGNLIGHYPSAHRAGKIFLLGSHLDTVRDAGKYDGPLGVLIAIACVQQLHQTNRRLPFAIEVVGFADEEGLRFQSSYLGSKALAGTFDEDLKRCDAHGISLGEAIFQFTGRYWKPGAARLDPSRLLGYAEVHIEQGPVLEQKNLPVGVVTAIAGQSRLRVEFHGVAGHAGTVPMDLRHDALVGAAELVLSAEHCGVTATVGKLEVEPGASNVIPGKVALTLDVRDQNDTRRLVVVRSVHAEARAIARRRGLKLVWTQVQQTSAVQCDKKLTRIFAGCVARRGIEVLKLSSGAGHDAAALSAICPVAMLFVRCKGGISHNPAESVKTPDVRVAIQVLSDFIHSLAQQT